MGSPIVCQKCGMQYAYNAALAGQQVQCQQCQNPILVPQESQQPQQTMNPLSPLGSTAPNSVSPFGQSPLGQSPLGHSDPFAQSPLGQSPLGQSPLGQSPLGQPDPFAQAPLGQSPLGQAAFGQAPPKPAEGDFFSNNLVLILGIGGGGLGLLLLLVLLLFLWSGSSEEPIPIADATEPIPTSPTTPSTPIVPAPLIPAEQPSSTPLQLPTAGGTAPSTTDPMKPEESLLPTTTESLLPTGNDGPLIPKNSDGTALSGTTTVSWSVKIEPPAEVVDFPAKTLNIQLPDDIDIWFPSMPSKYVAIKSEEHRHPGTAVFDLSTGKKVPRGIAEDVDGLAISPDGRSFVAVPRLSKSLVIFNMRTGKPIQEIPLNVLGIQFASRAKADFAGSDLLLVRTESVVTICDLPQKQILHQVTTPSGSELEISPDGRYFAVSSRNGISIFDIKEGTLAGNLHIRGVDWGDIQIAFSPDGKWIAGIAKDGFEYQFAIWNLADGKLEIQKKLESELREALPTFPKKALDWIPDGTCLLAFGHLLIDRETGGVLYVYPETEGSKLERKPIPGRQIAGIATTKFRGPTRLVTEPLPTEEQLAKVRESLKAGATVADMQLPELTKLDFSITKQVSPIGTGWTYKPQGVNVNPPTAPISISLEGMEVNGFRFAGYGSTKAAILQSERNDRGARMRNKIRGTEAPPAQIAVIDIAAGAIERKVNLPPVDYQLLDLSGDGNLALVGLKEGTFGRLVSRLDVYSVSENSGHVVGWRPYQEEQEERGISDNHKKIKWAMFLSGGKQVATLSGTGKFVVWNLPDCKALYTIHKISDIADVSPDRKHLLFDVNRKLQLFDLATARYSGSIATDASGYAFSPNGDRLAVSSAGAVKLFDLTNGKELSKFSLPTGNSFSSLQWCDDNFLIANRSYLIDLTKKNLAWSYEFPSERSSRIDGVPKIEDSPDYRIWFMENGQLVGWPVPSQQVKEYVSNVSIKDQAIVSPGSSVDISSISLNISGLSEAEAQAALKRAFAENKVTLDPNSPVKVSLRSQVVDTGEKLAVTTSRSGFSSPPGMRNPTGSSRPTDSNLQTIDQKRIVITISISGPSDQHWESRRSVAMRSYGAVKDPSQASSDLTTEMHSNAADLIRRWSVPEYIFPRTLKLGVSTINSSGESIQSPGN